MPSPTPSLERAPLEQKSPIGEVTVLVYGLAPGKSEVRVQPPRGVKLSRFEKLVVREIERAFQAFSRNPS